MYNIVLKGKQKEVTFSGIIFNNNEELELTSVDFGVLNDYVFIFDETEGKLRLEGDSKILALISLESEQIEKLKKIKAETRDTIINFYKSLLKGDEEFLFVDIGDKEFPYVITNQAVMDAKVKSPKYENALLYAFSDKILKANRKNISFKFRNYEEFQMELGKEIKKRNLKPNFDFQGQKAIKLKWSEIVS